MTRIRLNEAYEELEEPRSTRERYAERKAARGEHASRTTRYSRPRQDLETRACRTRDGSAKVTFATKSNAKRFMRRNIAMDASMTAYRCPECDGFHVGHRRR